MKSLNHRLRAMLGLALPVCCALSVSAAALRINGSTTVNLPVAEAAEILRAEKGLHITVDTQGGSSGGISMLGDGQVEIGMSSKPLAEVDRAKFPKVAFKEIRIGEDAVAMIVSKDVWEGGIHSLTKTQIRDIYEGKVANWKQVGASNNGSVWRGRSQSSPK